MTLSAKIGDWVSSSVTVGQETLDLNGFKNLTVNAPQELVGSQITFLLDGSVESTTTDYYAVINDDGSVCASCPIDFPQFREDFTIDFPSRPAGQPVEPAPGEPIVTLFSGQVFTPQGLVPDGYEVFAVVGDAVRSDNVTVVGGMYNLAVNTTGTEHQGSPISFYLIDKGDPTNPSKTLEADTPGMFNPGAGGRFQAVLPNVGRYGYSRASDCNASSPDGDSGASDCYPSTANSDAGPSNGYSSTANCDSSSSDRDTGTADCNASAADSRASDRYAGASDSYARTTDGYAGTSPPRRRYLRPRRRCRRPRRRYLRPRRRCRRPRLRYRLQQHLCRLPLHQNRKQQAEDSMPLCHWQSCSY